MQRGSTGRWRHHPHPSQPKLCLSYPLILHLSWSGGPFSDPSFLTHFYIVADKGEESPWGGNDPSVLCLGPGLTPGASTPMSLPPSLLCPCAFSLSLLNCLCLPSVSGKYWPQKMSWEVFPPLFSETDYVKLLLILL